MPAMVWLRHSTTGARNTTDLVGLHGPGIHHGPGIQAVEPQVVHHQDVVKVLHGPGIHHGPGSYVVETPVVHDLDAAREGHHGPGNYRVLGIHVVEAQVAHQLEAVTVDLHGPRHGPGVAPHHGHLVEASNHALPPAVGLSQIAVRSPVQVLQ
nr:unnamed protein product [Digitaria exilis]